ncbi:hypothetical protein [Undibacterium pigrum]|uniref:YD repeat-containing protein n=1 Tax=Undibacterium pigrum TaxID=401470 RepID=A0A318IM23_9BURK|nr:hypothetical protein [Undibacterium pigrum]PXX34920.1 YD repeat-containing protein [Undibacterium pigrum]
MKPERVFTPLLCLLTMAMSVACGRADDNASKAVSASATSLKNKGSIALFAGDMGGPGNINGTGTDARFRSLWGIAIDPDGNLFVSDYHRLRKITQEAVVSSFASSETSNSDEMLKMDAADLKKINSPGRMVGDAEGNIFVLDQRNCSIRKLTPAGIASIVAGGACTNTAIDSPVDVARFTALKGIALDREGNLFVSDSNAIRKITPAGMVGTVAGQAKVEGARDGKGGSARFSGPAGLVADPAGNIYIADQYNGTIRKLTPAGVVTTIAGLAGKNGSENGKGRAARFDMPSGVALDAAGNIYVADTVNAMIRKITPGGVVTNFVSNGKRDNPQGVTRAAFFLPPRDIVSDGRGKLYIIDESSVHKISADRVVTTVAGSSKVAIPPEYWSPVFMTSTPGNMVADVRGDLYVTESRFPFTLIHKISPMGAVSRFVDVKAEFARIAGLTVDASGNLYVADSIGTVRKISAAGVTTPLAGMPDQLGLADGAGSDARFKVPNGIALTSSGDVLLVDTANQLVRKVTADGVTSTFARIPLGQVVEDSRVKQSRFWPSVANGIAIDGNANVYVADGIHHVIFKISPAGVSSVFAGSTGQKGSADGSGMAARFNRPQGLTLDSKGNLYVADTDNNAVRKITPEGQVSTLIGSANREGFVAGPLPGSLSRPTAVVFSRGALYVSTYQGVVVARDF